MHTVPDTLVNVPRERRQSVDIFTEYRLRRDADAWLRAACTCDPDATALDTDVHGRLVEVPVRCETCALIGQEPDIYVNGHTETRPDRVAYRGVVRYRRPAPHRAMPNRDAVSWVHLPADDQTYVWQLDAAPFQVTHLATAITHAPRATDGTDERLPIVRRLVVGIGHRRSTLADDRQRTRTERRAERAAATGRTPGKAGAPRVAPWSASSRTIRRVWTDATPDQVAAAILWEQLLTTTVETEHAIDIGPLSVRRDGPANVIVTGHAAMSVREASRRAALAGMTTPAD